MPMLHERTRRFWTSTLFLLLGPLALGVVCLRIYWQTTTGALVPMQERFAQKTHCDLRVESQERLRPWVRRLNGVRFVATRSEKEICYCPEVYYIRTSNLALLHEFARAFDEFTQEQTTLASSHCWSMEEERLRAKETTRQSLADLIFSTTKDESSDNLIHANSALKRFDLLVVPTVICQDGNLQDALTSLRESFQTGRDEQHGSKDATHATCLLISQLEIASASDYARRQSQIQEAFTTRKSVPYTNRELLGALRAASYTVAPQSAQSNSESIRDEVIVFNSGAPTVRDLRILQVESRQGVRIDAFFELANLLTTRPYYASYETFASTDSQRFEFDATDMPTPCAFLQPFSPFFQILGSQGWFTGRCVAYDDADANDETTSRRDAADKASGRSADRFSMTLLNDLHFRNCDLASLSARFDLPRFSGTIADLSIETGAVRRGVFLGQGALKIQNGAIPVATLRRLCQTGQMEVAPTKALSVQFLNDVIPFNELELLFELHEDGVVFDSKYRNKIVAFYDQENTKYGFFLPAAVAGQPRNYAQPLSALFEPQDPRAFWLPVVRDALNHLPVAPQATAARQDERTYR